MMLCRHNGLATHCYGVISGSFLSQFGDEKMQQQALAAMVAWMRLDEVHRRLTFPNERRIAQTAWNRLAGTA